MKNAMRNFTISTESESSFPHTLDVVREALRQERLQVIAELPFEQKLEEATGVKWSKYTVLVVWSPMDAPHAVLSGREAGLFIPFNVVVKEGDETTVVTAMTHDLWDTPNQPIELRSLLREVDLKVRRALLSVPKERSTQIGLHVESRMPEVQLHVA
jgi:uncharacterized protein (DUF302 family)